MNDTTTKHVHRRRRFPVALIELGRDRVLRPGRWLWLRAAAWFVVLFFATAGAFGVPLQWAADRVPADNGPLQLAGRAVACLAAVAVYAVAVRFGEGRRVRELSLRFAVSGLAAGAVLGLVMTTVLMCALALTGVYDVTVGGVVPAWTAVGLALQAAVTEELWVRALLLRLVWRAAGPVPAFVLVAVAFAALHLSNPGATPLAAATVAMAGLMFSALYALTGRLWVPIGAHFAWNFTQGYLFGAAVSGGDLGQSVAVSTANPGVATWLSGGAFGPEASVGALGVVTLVTACAVSAVVSRRSKQSGEAT